MINGHKRKDFYLILLLSWPLWPSCVFASRYGFICSFIR